MGRVCIRLGCSGPAFLLAFLCLVGCEKTPEAISLDGEVFGTNWSLVYVDQGGTVHAKLVRDRLSAVFESVNASMNHYDPFSSISKFNELPANVSQKVDSDFAHVLSAAFHVGALSFGAYDVTVYPLTELWGFGPSGPREFPSDISLELVSSRVGLDLLNWEPTTKTLSKRVQGVSLDFSSLAKGYAVDLAADTLERLNLKDFMFEIGGEVIVRGESPRGDAWRIAVAQPKPESFGSIHVAIELRDTAIATSGDYRNFFEYKEKRYSHLIDPRSGYPLQHELVSVTVIHESAMMADAWATALIIMGSDAAMELAEDTGLAVYMLERHSDDLRVLISESMRNWLDDNVTEKFAAD